MGALPLPSYVWTECFGVMANSTAPQLPHELNGLSLLVSMGFRHRGDGTLQLPADVPPARLQSRLIEVRTALPLLAAAAQLAEAVAACSIAAPLPPRMPSASGDDWVLESEGKQDEMVQSSRAREAGASIVPHDMLRSVSGLEGAASGLVGWTSVRDSAANISAITPVHSTDASQVELLDVSRISAHSAGGGMPNVSLGAPPPASITALHDASLSSSPLLPSRPHRTLSPPQNRGGGGDARVSS
ncbi:MAG: hypothetical protein EOO40_02910, partial [Deltaproteobacteria bacterium]